MPQTSQYGTYPSTESSYRMQDVDHLVLKVLEVQDIRQKMHQLQEELNWEKQNFESLQGEGTRSLVIAVVVWPSQLLLNSTWWQCHVLFSPAPIQQNGLDSSSDMQKLQNHIQQLEYNLKAMSSVSEWLGERVIE